MKTIVKWHTLGRDIETIFSNFEEASDCLEMLINNYISFSVSYKL